MVQRYQILIVDEKEFIYKLFDGEIAHLKELMGQHDKLTEQAIEKAEHNLTDKLEKLHMGIEGLGKRFEDNMKSVEDKINTQGDHLEEKLFANMRIEGERNSATNKTMQLLIDSNAKTSNDRIDPIATWKESSEGSLLVINRLIGALITVVAGLIVGIVIYFITK